jgi:hypothetical protein
VAFTNYLQMEHINLSDGEETTDPQISPVNMSGEKFEKPYFSFSYASSIGSPKFFNSQSSSQQKPIFAGVFNTSSQQKSDATSSAFVFEQSKKSTDSLKPNESTTTTKKKSVATSSASYFEQLKKSTTINNEASKLAGKRGRPPKNPKNPIQITNEVIELDCDDDSTTKKQKIIFKKPNPTAPEKDVVLYNEFISKFPTNPNLVGEYIEIWKKDLTEVIYFEQLRESIKQASKDLSKMENVDINHYISLVNEHQELTQRLKDIESELTKSKISMFITITQLEKDKRLKEFEEDDNNFFHTK